MTQSHQLKEPLLKRSLTPGAIEFPKNVSWLSKLTFEWVTPLMKVGYSRPLREEDVFRVPPEHECARLTARLEKRFALYSPDLFGAIFAEWKWMAFRSGLWKLFNDGSQFAGPLIMSAILTQMASVSPSPIHLSILAFCMYLSQIIGGVGEAQYFQNGMIIGMELRSSLMSLIFKKSLRLTPHARMYGVSEGKLTNMISSDTESLQSFCEVMHVLWSAPLRIVCSMVLLYYLLGVAALAGAAVIFSLIPLQKTLVGKMTKRIRAAQKFTDQRLGNISETFEGIQLVKCYSWEHSFQERTDKIRDSELDQIRTYSLIRGLNSFLISAIPVIVAVVSFTAYSYLPSNPPLTASQAFTALSLFGVLRFPLMQLPNVINSMGACRVSLSRIGEFLTLPESVKSLENMPETISLSNSIFRWKDSFQLGPITLDLDRGDLLVVVGATASGKSSLLQALLGQMEPERNFAKHTSYCTQSAWIFSGTIRENIVWSSECFEEDKFWAVIDACALSADLAEMPGMDLTEIGERGVNLSGGQKQRISLARCVYSDSSLVLMDDPLSALDATVAAHVFEEAILKTMAHKTRILVTNRLETVLPFASESRMKFLIMGEGGKIAGFGNFEDMKHKFVFEDKNEKIVARKKSVPISKEDRQIGVKLISRESRQVGAVSGNTIRVYVSALGWFGTIVLTYALTEVMRVCASIWMSRKLGENVFDFLFVYVVLSSIQLLFLLISQILGAVCGNNAAKILHAKMYTRLLHAPMMFFNSTPLGRILNRFSKDVADMDRNLSPMGGMTLTVTMSLFGTLGILAATAYYTVLFFIPVLLMFYWCQEYYRASSREIKRMDSISRSPIYSHFQQIQDGIATVLAFGKERFVTDKIFGLIDNHMRFNLAQMNSNRWLGIRLEFYGGALVLVTALFIVGGNVSVGVAGLALSTALQVTGALGGIVRLSAMLENSLNSVERINEYSQVDVENSLGMAPPSEWPKQGAIEFDNVVARYRPSDPESVLKKVSFKIPGGSKVGIVGRTGAGKTSCILTLFRIVEIEEGRICIDGIDIAKITLAQLREHLGIIPQDPIVFEGSLRSNIDPFSRFTDLQLNEAVGLAHLAIPLDHEIVRGGKNLSAGQRQQICLCRVILLRPKILVLDEATSALDAATDMLVSTTIRTEFPHSTVISIAHRIKTIIDSDLVIVMDKGKVGEIGNPKQLAENPRGMFSALLSQSK